MEVSVLGGGDAEARECCELASISPHAADVVDVARRRVHAHAPMRWRVVGLRRSVSMRRHRRPERRAGACVKQCRLTGTAKPTISIPSTAWQASASATPVAVALLSATLPSMCRATLRAPRAAGAAGARVASAVRVVLPRRRH